MKKGPLGAGSHLASFSLPGDSFWISNVSPPSASRLNCGNIAEFSRYRLSGLAESRLAGSS